MIYDIIYYLLKYYNPLMILFRCMNPSMIYKMIGKDLYEYFVLKGPTFIKIGQILSTQENVFHEDTINELRPLQDTVPVVEEPLPDMATLGIYLKSYDPVPISSGSIAVVYKGILFDNKPVAIKVKRDDIDNKLWNNINEIKYAISFIEKFYDRLEQISYKNFINPLKPLNLQKKFEKIYSIIVEQLNFEIEAENIRFFYKKFRKCENIIIPKLYKNLCTSNMIVMEYIDGCTLYEMDCSFQERVQLLQDYLLFVRGTYKFGKLHSDLHPGNILITPDKKLCILDFGLITTIGSSDELYDLTISIVTNKYDNFIDQWLALCIEGDNKEQYKELFKNKFNTIDKKYPADIFVEFYKICIDNNIQLTNNYSQIELSMLATYNIYYLICPITAENLETMFDSAKSKISNAAITNQTSFDQLISMA